MEKSKLLEIRNILEDIKNNGFDKRYITYLDGLLNDSNIPLKYSRFNSNPAAFNPNYKVINININRLNKWLDEMLDYYMKNWDIKDINLLRAYLILYIYKHELEHVNQFLIGFNNKDTDYDFKRQVYRDVFSCVLKRNNLIPNPISLGIDIYRFSSYTKNAYSYILERNAPIEGYSFCSDIALLSNDLDIRDALIDSCNSYLLLGYLDDSKGCLFHTYRGLGMMNRYNKLNIPSDIPLEDKYKEGLELKDFERNILLTKVKSDMHCK